MRARARFEEGARAYRDGRFEDAIEHFRAAYDLDPAGALLLNIAQSYRRKTPPDCASALRHYELYLAAEPRAPERAEVETQIANMRRCLDETPAPVEAPVTTGAPAPPPPPTPPSEPSSPRSSTWAYVSAAGGLSLLAGAALHVRARIRYDELERECPCDDAVIDSWQTITNVSYGLMTAGALVATAGLAWRFWPAGRNEGVSLAWAWASPTGAGISWHARF